MTIGDLVIYVGACDRDYFPAKEPGRIQRFQGDRAIVKFTWGVQRLKLDSLRVIKAAAEQAAA